MKAWEIHNGKLVLHDVELARSCTDETIVCISHIGICGSDLPKLLQPSGFALPSRWRPGHEIVGTDPDGRAVVIEPLMPCKLCLRCVVGDTHLCSELRRLGWDLPGGFAEQVVVPATNVHLLPDGLKPITAILADAAAVAIHGLRCNPIGSPGRLAIIGAGVVGLLTAFYAHQQGWEVTVAQSDDQAPSEALVDAVPAVFQPSLSLQTYEPFDAVVDAATGAGPTSLELAVRFGVWSVRPRRWSRTTMAVGCSCTAIWPTRGAWETPRGAGSRRCR